MTRGYGLTLVGSIALGFFLLLLLIRVGNIGWRHMLLQLRNVRFTAFGALVLLNVVLVVISTAKWRSVDVMLREPSDAVPSKTTSFALTSLGMALGLVLPVQLGMATARTLGTYFYGRPWKRGTTGTLVEQGFDILIVSFLAVASGITHYIQGGAVAWSALAVCMVILALLLAGPAVQLGQRLASRAARIAILQTRLGNALSNICEIRSSTPEIAALARRLVVLSSLRFAVVVLMAEQTAQAIGANIPLWHMAAAVPFVVVATLLAITPGGLGVNELTSSTALTLFGTPMELAASWSLANRILIVAACFVVAAGSVAVLTFGKLVPSKAKHHAEPVEKA